MGNGFSYTVLAGALFLCFSGMTGSASAASHFINANDHAYGEVVVKLAGPPSGNRIRSETLYNLERALGPNSVLSVQTSQTDKTFHTLRLAKDEDLGTAMEILRADPQVEIVEPNYLYHALDNGIPDDKDFGILWGMHNTGQTDAAGQVGIAGSDIQVLPLWQQGITGNRDVLVAVIDTGADYTHPDLADNIYTNPGESGEKASNGKDDDNNGFIDDVHGWNFADKNNDPMDDHRHGTHVSGTIGGVGNNGQGVTGVNWQVSILPIRFLGAEGGGTLSAAVDAINYARQMKVRIMSNSWGGGSPAATLKSAIEAAKKDGILFVAAAGNESNNNDVSPTYPASYKIDNVLSVAATDNKDALATFSNFGEKTVHVAAPGVKIYSTALNGDFATLSGTSMATPHVSGIAALLLSVHPDWTYAEIKDRLIKTSDPIAGLTKRVLARGRVNAYNALNGIVPPPLDEPNPVDWRDEAFELETEHPYAINEKKEFVVTHPGAKFIRVVFDRLEVEQNYDKVILLDSAGAAFETLTGSKKDYVSEYTSGDTLKIRLESDYSNTGYGFKISRIQVIE